MRRQTRPRTRTAPTGPTLHRHLARRPRHNRRVTARTNRGTLSYPPRIWPHGWNARGQPLGAPFREGRGPMKGVATAVVAAIIIGTLYFGREVFVPIALAILLSFVLAPLVRLLQRWHLPRGLSVVGVVLLAFVSIFALGGVIATQATEPAGH